MRRHLYLAALAAACGSQPRYLGAPLPAACAAGDVERCAGWMAERDQVAGQLDTYDDERLRAYVQRVTDRLARGSTLARPPRVVIGDHDGTYAALGERIVIGRMAIERLGSEAELAAIVAHELVHVEGRHATVSLQAADDESWLVASRDAEAIADERAVALLERAGYSPMAMHRALSAVLDRDDDEHPPRQTRLAAVQKLAAGHSGYEGRAEFLARIDRMVTGRNTSLGTRVGDAWVIAALGVALDLPTKHVVRVDGDAVILRRGRSILTAYSIGTAWARELATELADRATATTSLGALTVGRTRARPPASTPIAKLQRAVRELLPQPAADTWVVVLARPRGGLVLELGASTDPYVRDRWLSGLRAATKRELRTAEPPRIELMIAPRTAPIRDLVDDCVDPEAAVRLDDPDRMIPRGEPFKCTDR